MCDIKCMWLFNLLAAAVLFILQQQQYVVASKVEIQQQHQQQQQLQRHNYKSPYDGISSYAAEAARKYLRRTSLPLRVVKREINNEKSTDFISYMNDLNIQDETSIPEDIIDQQHLQEIIDKQQKDIQQQERQQQIQLKLPLKYVVESTAVTSVLNGDDDIIDVNLPFDDSADTDSDADIILESRRSSEQNDDNKTYNSNGNGKNKSNKNVGKENEMFLEKRKEIDKNTDIKNSKKTFIKKEILKEEKTFNNNSEDNKVKENKPKPIKFENKNDYSNQYNLVGDEEVEIFKDPQNDAEGDEDKFELDVDDDDDGSAEYERFKSMREQKQKELQKQIEQMSTQEPMTDEETFNTQYSSEEVVKHMPDYTDDNNNKNKNINDYEIFHKHLLEQRKKLLQQLQQNHQPQPKPDAIGDIEENEDRNVLKTTVSNNNKNNGENKKHLPDIFIPRKIKRHNAVARSEDVSNRFTRINQEEDEEVQQQQQIKSPINTEENHSEAVAKVSTQEEIFKKKYYDILKENSTSAADHHIQQRQQPSGVLSQLNRKEFGSYGDNDEIESTDEVKKQTAFEKEKSLRRSNKRYGHKTHKKKYKDYLRYSQIMTMSTTNSTPFHEHNLTKNALEMATGNNQEHIGLSEDDVADLNGLRDKHAKKLKLEKIKTLIPQAPIFVLKAHDEKGKSEQLKEMEQQEEKSGIKPFYEGQINYFLETPDDDSERANEVRFITKGERMDTSDWYRKLSPVLRNGSKKINAVAEERSGIGIGRSRGGYNPYQHYRLQQQSQLHHGRTRNHHYKKQQQHHHHHQQQQQRIEQHRQFNKHSRHHAYQRKMLPKRLLVTTTPLPSPSRKQAINGLGEIGHQITEIKDLDRYYAKWPHLARVQSKLHEEQLREQHMENYPDYEYDTDDYFDENENKDENLPPYIRKFNRRNKQLLDLLEGTIAPPAKLSQQLRWSGSKLQTGQRDSSVGSMSVHIDDDYLKEKRKRYHQRQRQIQDLFAQQKTSTTTTAPPPYPFVNAKTNTDDLTAQQFSHAENHLPDEDISISLESTEQENEPANNIGKQEGGDDEDDVVDSQSSQEIWQQEIETKSNGNLQKTNLQMEKLITSTPSATAPGRASAIATKKSAIYKLPSYPSIAGGFMNRPRSRSSQFAPSSGSEFRRAPTSYLNNLNSNNDNMNNNNNNFINAGGFVAYNKAPIASKTINGRFSANLPSDFNKHQQSVLNITTNSPDTGKTQSSSSDNNHLNPPSPSASSSSVTNSFIYHRVVDASPRFVGAGFIAGRKQRLPFVAITDRRLETSKKSLTDHQKDFEQNHYPLP